MKTVKLTIPIFKSDVKKLRLGDLVYFNGLFFTCRSAFHIRLIDQGIPPPIDTDKLNVMFHAGPVIIEKNGRWEVVAFQPTTSNRYEKWGAKAIEKLGLRVIVGKGTMGEKSAKAIKKYGCVHCTTVGVGGAILSTKLEVKERHWPDLGPIESLWVLEAKELGPFMVDIDVQGNRYFARVNTDIEKKRDKVYAKLGIPQDFKFASLVFKEKSF